jgi:glycerol-3-phosphate O-acyltransferase/dihydroxyacetone phosphate acyltransferase
MKQFFRDISVLGLHNIPKKGPVIFCGNHNNQFVDGVILFFTASRDVRFMVAAKVSFF